jgi:hypothetical protein
MNLLRRAHRSKSLALTLLLATSLAHPAAAQSRDTAAATELFEKGRSAMKQQDYATACAAFADSQRFDAKVGTLLNLADCEERLSRLISARAHWQQAADLAHAVGDARENVARQRFMALDPRVAKLAVRLSPSAPAGAVVRRDEVELGAGSLGVALPADPGTHTIVVSAPGYDDATTKLTLGEGEVQEVVVGPGAKVASPVPPQPVVAAPPPTRPGSTQRVIGVVAASVGVAAGVAVGTYFGLTARKTNDSSYANDGCNAANMCNQAGLAERSDAVHDGNISTIAFIAGGVLAAAGVVLWLTAPSGSGEASGPSSGLILLPGGVAVRGGF